MAAPQIDSFVASGRPRMRNYLPKGRGLVRIGPRAPHVRRQREPIPVAKPPVGASTSGGSRRSMGRGVKVAGGQINKAGLPQVGESGL